MADKKIKCVADLIKNLNIDKVQNGGAVWYRGHADSSWKLESAYERLKKHPKDK